MATRYAQPGPLALLGDAIAGGAAQYAAVQQQRQQREQQLADVAAARAFQQQQIEEQRAYQDYVRDTERLAAERSTGEQRDYSDYVRGQERAAAREDVASARAFERETRQEGWKHEENLYTNRRHDAIKTQLMLDGHLKPGDLDKPEAFEAALQAGGPQYKRDLQELAEYKAAIPEILKSTRGEAGIASRISEILDLKPANIGRARELMKDAYGMIAKTVDTEKDQKELNAKNGALLMMAHLGKLAEIDNQKATLTSEMDRLAGNNFTPKELGEIRAKALANLIPDYQKAFAKGAPSDKAKAALAAEESKAADEVKLIAQSTLGARAKSLDNQMGRVASQYEGVKAAIQTGTAGYMDPKQTGWAFNTGPSKEAPAPKEKVISRADAQKESDAFTAGLGGPAAPTAPAAPAPTVTQPLPPTTGDVVPVPQVGAPPVVPPPAAAPAAIAPEPPPWWSLKGIYDRREQINKAVPEMLVNAPARLAAKGIAAGGQGLDRLIGAAGRGIYMGDYTIPQQGPMAQMGSALGEGLAATIPAAPPPVTFGTEPKFTGPLGTMFSGESLRQREAEDRILTAAPYSLQAIEIRRKRNIPTPTGSPGSLLSQ